MRGLPPSTVLWRAFAVSTTAAAIGLPFPGCAYHGSYSLDLAGLFNAPLGALTSSSIEGVVFEEPDRVQVSHGKGCTRMETGQGAVRVEQSVRLPQYATDATVFLNGSDMRYLSSDHKIHRVATVLGRIAIAHGSLNWQAAAAFEDQNGDDAFEWCYNYTSLAWNSALMRARANHDDGLLNSGDGRSGSALQSMPGFSQGWYFGNDPYAVLPRGSGVAWYNDRKLHQIGYALGASERFVQSKREYRVPDQQIRPEPSLFGPGFVSWDGASVFKDDQAQVDYRTAQMVSILGGEDVGIVQPPFTLVPARADGCPNVPDFHPPHTNDHVVEQVPYAWAVPILAAWDLTYYCDDHNVAHVGASLDSFSYERPPGSPTGTLRYRVTTNLADKDEDPVHTSRYTIHILGIRERTTSPTASAALKTP